MNLGFAGANSMFARPNPNGFVGAILVIAHHAMQTPFTTLEIQAAGHLGEAMVSQGSNVTTR